MDEYSGRTHFVVKVQAQPELLGPSGLLVYNKGRKIYGFVNKEDNAYDGLLKAVNEEDMFGGLKAYFYAILDKDRTLSINFKKRQVPESW